MQSHSSTEEHNNKSIIFLIIPPFSPLFKKKEYIYFFNLSRFSFFLFYITFYLFISGVVLIDGKRPVFQCRAKHKGMCFTFAKIGLYWYIISHYGKGTLLASFPCHFICRSPNTHFICRSPNMYGLIHFLFYIYFSPTFWFIVVYIFWFLNQIRFHLNL